jgi:lipopolysaccharide heptosyltransferase II
VKILFVRLRLVGDVVFTTPIIRAVRRRYPGAELTYVVEPPAAPVIRSNPHLNDVIVVPTLKGLARLRNDAALAWRLRQHAFDIAIDLHGGPRSSWLTWASGAPMRIGYRIKGRSWMYTVVVDRSADLAPRHSVVNQWDLLRPLGIDDDCDPVRDAVEMAEDPSAAAAVDSRLAGAAIDPTHPLVLIHVSAGNPFRRWPPAAFEELVVGLARRDARRRIVLTSGPSEAAAAAGIASQARARLGALASAVPDLGEFDLAELRALAGRASVYIGGDSGPMHVAATTDTPIVAVLGPTLLERSKPWRDPSWFSEVVDVTLPCRPCHQRTCQPGDFRCLTWIEPARVLEAAERALAASPRAARPH